MVLVRETAVIFVKVVSVMSLDKVNGVIFVSIVSLIVLGRETIISCNICKLSFYIIRYSVCGNIRNDSFCNIIGESNCSNFYKSSFGDSAGYSDCSKNGFSDIIR